MISLLTGLLVMSATPAQSAPQDYKDIAARTLHIAWDDDDDHVLVANWNGHPYLFVDYLKAMNVRSLHLKKSVRTTGQSPSQPAKWKVTRPRWLWALPMLTRTPRRS